MVTVSEGRAALTKDEAHHLIRVRRLRKGDDFVGLDGQGHTYRCRLRNDGKGWYGEVVEVLPSSSSAQSGDGLRITLGPALIKKDRLEWILQKATELGASRIVPLITTRSEVRILEDRLDRKMARWEKILQEAVKQSGRTEVPQLNVPAELEDFCRNESSEVRLALDEQGDRSLSSVLSAAGRAKPVAVSVIVGPEGGWDDKDRALFQEHGWTRVRLGSRIMRAETAPIAILAILQYEWGDLGAGD